VFYLPKVQPSKLNTYGFIFQKSNLPSSMLDVLSSKSPTFQAQTLDVLSLKSPTFQVLNLAIRPYFVYSFALLCLLFCSFFF